MRDIGEGTIRRIDWQELIPVVLFARVFRAACNFRILFFAMLGVLLTLVAGHLSNHIFLTSAFDDRHNVENIDVVIPAAPIYIEPLIDLRTKNSPIFRDDPINYSWQLAQRSVLVPWDVFSRAGLQLFSLKSTTWTQRGIAFGWLLYLLVLWSFVGGLICRSAGLRYTLDQGDSLNNLLRFVRERGTGYLSSVLIVSLGLCLFLGLMKLFGLAYSLPYADYPAAFLFPISLLFGFLFMVLGIGLFVGWPLMFAAVSVEGTDGFDAVSRMFSYVYQRPFHYLFYLVVGGVTGVIWFALVSLFIDGMVHLAVSVGSLPSTVMVASLGELTSPRANMTFPESIVLCWCAMAQLLKIAFVFTWFWCANTATYLLLRRSVDGTPYHEIFRFGANAAPPRKLPDIPIGKE